MHGAGNDYVYVDCFRERVDSPAELSVRLSDRHKGVGADGLVLIMRSDACDFRMRIFNADGSEAQMCGNASRCVAKFLYDKGYTNKTVITLETLAGMKTLELLPEGGEVCRVRVDMGEPVFETSAIPVKWHEKTLIDRVADFGTCKYAVTCVSMGNPHAVIFTDPNGAGIDSLNLKKTGSAIENHPMFPERVNVEFVEILSPVHARMRVWERGSGETQACGTGACAVAAAAFVNNKLERKATISLPGGDLELEWKKENNHIYMTGDAVKVFEGEWSNDKN